MKQRKLTRESTIRLLTSKALAAATPPRSQHALRRVLMVADRVRRDDLSITWLMVKRLRPGANTKAVIDEVVSACEAALFWAAWDSRAA